MFGNGYDAVQRVNAEKLTADQRRRLEAITAGKALSNQHSAEEWIRIARYIERGV